MTIITVLFAIALGTEIDVPAKTGGRVLQVFVEEGEPVRAGQPLATLETDHLLPVLREAEAVVVRMRDIEADAEREYQRNPKARAKYEAAIAAREAAWMEAARLRRRFFDAIIRAPHKGVVRKQKVMPADIVGAGDVAFVIVREEGRTSWHP
ncbi:MAG TPA: biotin/lipoyl-binding protein [Thermoanaerobaculia bacterium]|nr:biotin/lipoyl-binding protein [Thermoanaerobaculia bacterium]